MQQSLADSFVLPDAQAFTWFLCPMGCPTKELQQEEVYSRIMKKGRLF